MTRLIRRLAWLSLVFSLLSLPAVLSTAPAMALGQPVADAPSAQPGASAALHAHHERSSDAGPEAFIPIVVPLAFFGTVVFIVAFALVYRFRKEAARLELARVLAEASKPIPEGLLAAAPRAAPASDLKRGFVLVATGLGLSVAALFVGQREAMGVGFIPGFIGLAYLAVWRIQRGRPERGVEV